MTRAPHHQLVHGLRRTVEAYRLDGSTDAELLERFRTTADPAAFEAIVRRHGGRVLAACHKVLADPADVEDTFQATFIVLLKNAHSIRQQQSLGGWLYGVAHRTALQARVRAARRSRIEANTTAREGAEPLDLSWREACAVLHEELDRLPDKYRLPLVLCYLEGKSRDEAASDLGVETGVLRGRLERGRDQLRGRLAKRGITLSAGLLGAVANSVPAGGPPEVLLRATLEAVTTGKIPAKVAALLHGATPSMTLGKFTSLAALFLIAGLIAGGLGLHMRAAEPAVKSARPAPNGEQAKSANPETKSVAVSGKVLGPDGRPVAKAKLFVFDTEQWKPAPQAESGADGAFAFELPPLEDRRSYRSLVATAPGFGCDWVSVAAAGTPLRDAVLKLPEDEPIRGRVVDLEGRPVRGAVVRATTLQTGADDTLNEFIRLWTPNRDSQQEAITALMGKRLFANRATADYFTAATNDHGEFTLAGIGRDRCAVLLVSAKGQASVVGMVAVRPEFKPAPGGITGSLVFGPEFTLPLAPSKPITGVVRDADGKPLAGVRVAGHKAFTDSAPSGWLILPDVEAFTDAEGRYTLDGLGKAKRYALVADPKPGVGPAHAFAIPADDAPGYAAIRADFDLPHGVVLTGRLTDKRTGEPVRGHVFYRPLAGNTWLRKHPVYDPPTMAPHPADADAWTDNDGRFRLTAVPGEGVLHVQVLGHRREREYTMAKLAPEDDNDDVVAWQGVQKVFNTRGPRAGYGPHNLNAYRVLRIPADAKAFTADVSLDPGVNRVVKLVDPDGKAVTGAWVMNDRGVATATWDTHPGSEVTIHALDRDKPRRIYVQHDERKLAGVLTLDGKDTAPEVLKLEPTATVRGRVVDQRGAPLASARVTPSFDEPEIGNLLNTMRTYGQGVVRTDAEGRFTLANVPAGLSVKLAAQSRGGVLLGFTRGGYKLKPGETLELGDWKPE